MKQVFRLIVQIEDFESDLFFEDQNTAEKTLDILSNLLTDKAKKNLHVKAEIHEIYSKETALEQILKGLGMNKQTDEINK